MTTMHDYGTIAAIVGEDKINALREAGVEISDKPTKPTTNLLGRWAKYLDGKYVLIISESVQEDGQVRVAFRINDGECGTATIKHPLSDLTFPEETTRPEDVEPGEAWLVNVDDGEDSLHLVAAIKYGFNGWYTGPINEIEWWPNADVTLVSPLVPARPEPQSEHPRTLTSVEDYESAPAGTIVAKPRSSPCTKHFSGDWHRGKTWLTDSEMADTERQVLREGWGE